MVNRFLCNLYFYMKDFFEDDLEPEGWRTRLKLFLVVTFGVILILLFTYIIK